MAITLKETGELYKLGFGASLASVPTVNFGAEAGDDPGGGGEGTMDHNKLTNRTIANQHPIGAITNLQATLDQKLEIGDGDYLDMDFYQIKNVGAPTADGDAATKAYVDGKVPTPKYFHSFGSYGTNWAFACSWVSNYYTPATMSTLVSDLYNAVGQDGVVQGSGYGAVSGTNITVRGLRVTSATTIRIIDQANSAVNFDPSAAPWNNSLWQSDTVIRIV